MSSRTREGTLGDESSDGSTVDLTEVAANLDRSSKQREDAKATASELPELPGDTPRRVQLVPLADLTFDDDQFEGDFERRHDEISEDLATILNEELRGRQI